MSNAIRNGHALAVQLRRPDPEKYEVARALDALIAEVGEWRSKSDAQEVTITALRDEIRQLREALK